MKKLICVLILVFSLVTVAYAEGTPTDIELGTQTDGTIITQAQDGTILIDTSALDGDPVGDGTILIDAYALDGVGAGDGDFLTKSFNSYSVTEGFLLIYLILFFCVLCWCVIRRCFNG